MLESVVLRDVKFNFLDYFLFGITIVISIIIGIYYGYFKKTSQPVGDVPRNHEYFGSDDLNQYLMGSKKLHAFPVGLSLLAGYISGIELHGTPEEIYYYGTQYWLILFPVCIMGLIVSFVYIPVYHALGVSTSYQYLGLRFHPYVDTIASVVFVLDLIFYLPLVVYGPAISFNQVSGADVYVFSFILCVSCAIYTIIGGATAVITTGTFQIVVMFLSQIAIIIYGLICADGLQEVISKNKNSAQDRFQLFNFTPTLYGRNTFWSVLFGGLSYWISFNAVHQIMVQRYISLPNTREAQISCAIFICFLLPFISLCCLLGLQIYAFYEHCDPLTAGLIHDEDQIVTLYIIQALGHHKSAAGIHLAGVVGAALSSLSTVVNCTTATIYENILKGFFKLKFTKANSDILIRIIVVVLEVIALGSVFYIEKLGSILGTLTSMTSIAASSIFGIFTLGMLIPWSNTRGALIGGFAGVFITAWIALGTQIKESQNVLPSYKLPNAVSGCAQNLTITTTPEPDPTKIFPLYRISDLWISSIGVVTVLTVGTIASFLYGPTDPKTLDRNLISPVLHRWLPVH